MITAKSPIPFITLHTQRNNKVGVCAMIRELAFQGSIISQQGNLLVTLSRKARNPGTNTGLFPAESTLVLIFLVCGELTPF